MASFSPKRAIAVDPLDRRVVALVGDQVAGVTGHRMVRVVVDLGAGDDRAATRRAGAVSDRIIRVLAWPRSPRKMMSCPASRAFSSCGQHRVLVAEHARRPAAGRPGCVAAALRRTSSFTGTDSHPDSRSWPSVAGREVMALSLSPPTGTLRRGRPGGAATCGAGSAVAGGPIGALPSDPWRSGDVAGGGRRRAAAAGLASEDFDDRDWAAIAVPGHWRSTAAFATTDGPLLYRRRFEAQRPPARRARVAAARRDLLPGRRLARRELRRATPRATSSPTPSRSPRRWRDRVRARPGRRAGLLAARATRRPSAT